MGVQEDIISEALPEMREWLVGRTIIRIEWDRELNIFSIFLDDDSVLLTSTEVLAKGLVR